MEAEHGEMWKGRAGKWERQDEYGEPNKSMTEVGFRKEEREGLYRRMRDQSRAEIKGMEEGRTQGMR